MFSLRPESRTRLLIAEFGHIVSALVLFEGHNNWYWLFLGLGLISYLLYSFSEDEQPSPGLQYGDFRKEQ